MKTCEEMTASLLRRRDAYYRERRKKVQAIGASAAGCLIVGIGVFALARGTEVPAVDQTELSSASESLLPRDPAAVPSGNNDPETLDDASGQTDSPLIQDDICHHIITEKDYGNGAACYASPRIGEITCSIGLREAMADYAYDPMTLFVVRITLDDGDGPMLSSADDLALYRAEADRINQSGGAQWLEAVLNDAPIVPPDGELSTETYGSLFLSGSMTADQIRALSGGAYGYFVELGDFPAENATAE